MRKKPTRKRPYFKMESAMTAILRDASGKMHHGILFDPPLDCNSNLKKSDKLKKLYTNKTKWKTIQYGDTNQISSSSQVFKCKNREICGWQFEAIFHISGVWHVR